jgi:hypothetical protein
MRSEGAGVGDGAAVAAANGLGASVGAEVGVGAAVAEAGGAVGVTVAGEGGVERERAQAASEAAPPVPSSRKKLRRDNMPPLYSRLGQLGVN